MSDDKINIKRTYSLWGKGYQANELREILNSMDKEIVNFVIEYKYKENIEDRIITKITKDSTFDLSYQKYLEDKKSCKVDFMYDNFSQYAKMNGSTPINIGKDREAQIILHLAKSKNRNTSTAVAEALNVESLNPGATIRQAIQNLNKKIEGEPIIIRDPLKGYIINPKRNWVIYREYL